MHLLDFLCCMIELLLFLYKFGFETGTTQTGYASAIAYILFLIILTVSVVQFKLFNKED